VIFFNHLKNFQIVRKMCYSFFFLSFNAVMFKFWLGCKISNKAAVFSDHTTNTKAFSLVAAL
jgi:hypothetical protein